MRYNYQKKIVITADAIDIVKLWSPSSSIADIVIDLGQCNSNRFLKAAVSIEVSPDGNYFSVLGCDRTIYVCGSRTGKVFQFYEDHYACSDARALPFANAIFDRDSNYLLFASDNGINVMEIKSAILKPCIGSDIDCRLNNITVWKGDVPLLMATGLESDKAYIFRCREAGAAAGAET